MGHLASCATQLDTDVVSGRSNPGRPVDVGLFHVPEANVMAFLGAVPNWFFKSQIFFPSEKKKITDRSLIIRFSQNGIDHDSNAAANSQRIGGIPSGGCHGPDDFFLGAEQGDI